jgi:hypothetical protein
MGAALRGRVEQVVVVVWLGATVAGEWYMSQWGRFV